MGFLMALSGIIAYVEKIIDKLDLLDPCTPQIGAKLTRISSYRWFPWCFSFVEGDGWVVDDKGKGMRRRRGRTFFLHASNLYHLNSSYRLLGLIRRWQ